MRTAFQGGNFTVRGVAAFAGAENRRACFCAEIRCNAAIFGFRQRKESAEMREVVGEMKIEVLGSGCFKCQELERRVKEAVKNSGVDATVEHIYDIQKIIQRSVFSTPALAIDGKVIFSGRIPSIEELSKIISGK